MGEEDDIHDHLLPPQQRVADELARAQRDGLLAVGHGGGAGLSGLVGSCTA